MTEKKKIAFVLNTVGMTGGVRVVFEYAKRFKADGFEVEVIHLLKLKPGFKSGAIALLKKLKWKLKGCNNIGWFDLGGVPVNHQIVLDTDAERIIATAYETAKPVNDYNSVAKKIYFIQGYESWGGREADKTYGLPLERITISSYLADLLKEKFNANTKIVSPGIDLAQFEVKDKKYNRDKVIAMMYHTLPEKGAELGLKALNQIVRIHPEIKFQLFGMYELPTLPKNSTYTKNPSRKQLREIYASSDIYIIPSLSEGFGLTALEAMTAGCALVMTKTGGYKDFSEDGESAAWVNPGDADDISKAVIDLIEHDDKLKRIAKSGQKRAENFTIEKAYQQFKDLILK